ncbi:TA system antitoxin ParD family protein [Roseateles sp.]|uniref:TA system antitoxin ParD family protein n=1 Tax=Roseateles sp. TaxID=1971397 RepID=UPI00394D04B3
MTSNSIRISAELFNTARDEGAVLSRSTAQQVEHWARLGAALEATGLSVAQVAALLQREGAGDAALWAHKRAQQQADMKNARAGRVSQEQLSWFSGNKAKRVKLSDTPY